MGKPSSNGHDQVVVVTGASGGIGRATARQFGARGAQVALLARGEKGLAGAAHEVETAGGKAMSLSVDIADPRQVERAAGEVERRFGPIDVWINVAFTSIFAPFHEISADEYKRVTEVAYLGYVYSTMAALRRMRARDQGAIVQPKQAQPVPPIYQPEVAASAVVYAADHPKRREYWVGGTTTATLIADKFAPGLLDRYLSITAYKSQQTDQPRPQDQPANLWDAADGPNGRDFGAHGMFDARSTDRSYQLWASQHHGLLGGIAGAVAAAAGITGLAMRR